MGLLHQINGGVIGNRGVVQGPSVGAYSGGTLQFYLPGNSTTETISGLQGTIHGNVSISTDNPFGHAAARSFEFGNGRLEFAASNAHLQNNAGFSISWWMKWDGTSSGHQGYHTMFARRSGGTSFESYLDTNNHWISYYSGTNHNNQRVRPPRDAWVHMAIKHRNYNGGQVRQYMNGLEVNSGNNMNGSTSSLPFALGDLPGGNNETFRGHICDFALFDGIPSFLGSSFSDTFDPPEAPVAGGNVIPPGVQQTQTI